MSRILNKRKIEREIRIKGRKSGNKSSSKEREREIESDFFLEIRTDNPSLAVQILNGTPRPIFPS